MPSVIDTLFVELGLDPRKFIGGGEEAEKQSRKTKDQIEKDSRSIEDASRKSGQSLQKLRGDVLMLFAAFTAGRGLKEFVQSIVETDAGLGRMSLTLDQSIQKLSSWAGAGQMIGATGAEIIGTFQSLTSQFQQFSLTGQSQVVPYFRALGVNIANSKGQMRDMGDVLLDLSDKFHAMDPARAKAFADAMGISPGTLNLLIQGRAAVEAYLATAKKYAPTQDDVRSAIGLQKAWAELNMASSAMGRTFLTELTPALLAVLKALTGIAEWLDRHPVALTALLGTLTAAVLALSTALAVNLAGSAFTAVLAGFGLLAGALPTLFLNLAVLTETVLPGVAEGFLSVGIGIEAALGPLGLIIAGLTLLGIVGKVAWDNLDKVHQKKLEALGAEETKGQQGAANRDNMPTWAGGKGKAAAKSGSEWLGLPAAPSKGPGAVADLISKGEGGYSSVNLGKRGGYKSGKRDLEQMTVGEVMAAQARGEFNAVGRYQMTRETLAEAVQALHIDKGQKFDSGLQDRLFKDYLISKKRPEIGAYLSGKSNDLNAALKAASKEWASVADPDTGQSHYAGVGNNRSSISAGDMARALQTARAANHASPTGGAAQVAAAGAPGGGSKSMVANNETHIGTINVHTQATDAKGIAEGIKTAIARNSFAQQGNFGST